MAETKTCPKCGAELSPDAPAGICPKCLMQAGLGSQATADQHTGASTPLTPDERAAATVLPSPRFPTPYLETLARQFPQLEILELLGQGGMGVVYKARQRQLNRLVAVKILPPSVGEDPAFTERFAREAQALAQLNHPHIVQVYDFGQTDEFFYFVMEYVDGVNLRALIRGGRLEPEEALRIVPQICEALQFAHDEGIVHRDIKPENILIDKKGRVKIADFGLAKLLGRAPEELSLTGTGQLMGTLGYMAPEQLQQAHTVDHRADIYSLGVVFYEMLTGQLPIGRFELPSKKVQVDVRLDEIVLRSLESEPDRRYQHAVDVKTDVEHIAQSIVCRPSESHDTLPAEIKPAPPRLIGVSILLVLALIVWPVGLAMVIPGAIWLGLVLRRPDGKAVFRRQLGDAETMIRGLLNTTRCAIIVCLLGLFTCLFAWTVLPFTSGPVFDRDSLEIIAVGTFVALPVLLVATSFQQPIPIWRPVAIAIAGVVVILATGMLHGWSAPYLTERATGLSNSPAVRNEWTSRLLVGIIANGVSCALGVVLLFLGAAQMRGILMFRRSE
jgi:predicted Ser/Thr protein kinase